MKAFGPSSATPPAAKAIILEVAAKFGLTVRMIRGDSRFREIVIARAEIARRLSRRGYSSPRIAAILGKNHTTILYYLGRGKRGLKLRPTDPVLTEIERREAIMKLTPEQRERLAQLAAEGGFAGSKKFAEEIGCSPNYGLVLLKRENRPRRHSKKWQRALQVGPVLA